MHRLIVAPLLAVTLAFTLSGCYVDDIASLPAPVPPSIEALYGPAATTILSPFPSDRYTVGDPGTHTGLRVNLGVGTTADPMILMYSGVAAELSEMDGFSTSGGVIAGFSGPIDLRGIIHDPDADPPIVEPARDAYDYASKDAPFFLLDVDPKSPEHGAARGLVPRWWAQAKDVDVPLDDYTLVAQPAVPLRPGTRYLFGVTRRLKAADGGEIGRSADTDKLLRGQLFDGYGLEVSTALAEMEASLGVPREDLVLATAFTRPA